MMPSNVGLYSRRLRTALESGQQLSAPRRQGLEEPASMGQYFARFRDQQMLHERVEGFQPVEDSFKRQMIKPALAQAVQARRLDSNCHMLENAEASSSRLDPGVRPLTPAAFTYVHDTVESMATANPPTYAHWMYTYTSCYNAITDKSSCAGGTPPDMDELVTQVQQAFLQATQSAAQQRGYDAFMQACDISLRPMEYAFRRHEKLENNTLRTAAETIFVDRRRELCRQMLSNRPENLPDGVIEKIAAAIQVAVVAEDQ